MPKRSVHAGTSMKGRRAVFAGIDYYMYGELPYRGHLQGQGKYLLNRGDSSIGVNDTKIMFRTFLE